MKYGSVLALALSLVQTEAQCSFPEPAKGFTNEKYEGRWFEIGKIQTKGGAFFERNCVCTQIGIEITNSESGDGIADNDCRYKTVDGKWTNVTGTLYGEDTSNPGRWLEAIGSGSPVNYTVIALDENYSVEYDCGTSNMGITNYCVHIMSRTPTMDDTTFQQFVDMAESMGLNPQELPVTMTKQEGC
jgi:apolipoprotein D and lipocalin family protein